MLPVSVGKTPGSSTDSLTIVLTAFDSFVDALNRLYNLSLAVPQVKDLSELSKFCLGLVEKDKTHLWWREVRCASVRSRFGISHSLFLFRKVIPKEKPLVSDYVDKLAVAQDRPDEDFIAFARSLTSRLFRPGWDRVYQDSCLTSSLPLTSCAETGRRGGGCRGLWRDEWESRAEFCEYVLKSSVAASRGVSRVKAIETGGKWRIISIPPRVDNALRPLHKAIYSHLSQCPWLLRGDAKAGRFKDFTPVEGEVFVSGDYESATDNLNSVLQLEILDVLLSHAYTVPQGIVEHVKQIYHSALDDGSGRVVLQQRGQLMGQLTSFPLLCLINYITFRYCVRRPVPVRINGDDIVFRATPAEVARWERGVAKGGLTLSKGKTLIHRRGFTLNSTPFWACPGGAQSIGFLRSSALFPKGELSQQIVSLNGRFYSACSGYGAERKREVRNLFLRLNQKAIRASRRSVTRGLGLAADEVMLKACHLWHRELFYLEQVKEPTLPCVEAGLPRGWKQVSAAWMSREAVLRWERLWASECVDFAWVHQPSLDESSEDTKMRKIREGVPPYGLGNLIAPRVRRILRMTRSQVWRWVNQRRNSSVFGRVRPSQGRRVWVEVSLLAARTQISFVCANS